jgi:hypothetical protein
VRAGISFNKTLVTWLSQFEDGAEVYEYVMYRTSNFHPIAHTAGVTLANMTNRNPFNFTYPQEFLAYSPSHANNGNLGTISGLGSAHYMLNSSGNSLGTTSNL